MIETRIFFNHKRDIKQLRKVIVMLVRHIKLLEQSNRFYESLPLFSNRKYWREAEIKSIEFRYKAILEKLADRSGFLEGEYRYVAPCDDMKSIVILG